MVRRRPDLGDNRLKYYIIKNGKFVKTLLTASTTTFIPTTITTPKLGDIGTFGNTFAGKIYRSYFDDLSNINTLSDIQELVARDYNVNVGRFT